RRPGLPHLLADDRDAALHHGLVHREGHAQALVTVTPVFVVVAEEEIMAGDDQHSAFLQPFVQFARGDRKPREPEPEEERAFATMYIVFESVAETLRHPLAGEAGFLH